MRARVKVVERLNIVHWRPGHLSYPNTTVTTECRAVVVLVAQPSRYVD